MKHPITIPADHPAADVLTMYATASVLSGCSSLADDGSGWTVTPNWPALSSGEDVAWSILEHLAAGRTDAALSAYYSDRYVLDDVQRQLASEAIERSIIGGAA